MKETRKHEHWKRVDTKARPPFNPWLNQLQVEANEGALYFTQGESWPLLSISCDVKGTSPTAAFVVCCERKAGRGESWQEVAIPIELSAEVMELIFLLQDSPLMQLEINRGSLHEREVA